MDPASLTVFGSLAGANLLAGLFGAQAQKEQAEKEQKLRMTQSSLQNQQAGQLGAISNQQSALANIVNGMRL